MKEDPTERAAFDREVKRIYNGNWSQIAPEQSSFGKTMAIYANEVMKAADIISQCAKRKKR